MRATNAAGMIMDGFVPSKTRSTRRVGYAASVNYFLSLWGLAVLLTCSFGCGPSSSVGDGQQSTSSSPSNDRPELTDDVIRDRINHTRVREIPEENGTAEPISWRFDEEEPKEIKVVEKQVEGNRASIIRGYNQMGQCYDTIGSDPSTVPCINGYIYGNYELGMCR